MAANSADQTAHLSRFACLGTTDGTYHVLKRKFECSHAEPISCLLALQRGPEVLKRLKTIANKKRYIKKENMLFSLAAMVSTLGVDGDDHRTDPLSQEAFGLAQELCETPQDLFNFVHFNKQLSVRSKLSWGRGMRTLVDTWYAKKSAEVLAVQATQCKSGHGFSHRDLIRQVHLNSDMSAAKDLVHNYLLKGKEELNKLPPVDSKDKEEFNNVLSYLGNLEKLKSSQDTETEVIRSLIEKNKFTDKQIPSHFFRLKETFEGMLDHMTLISLIRSVPKMAELGLLNPESSDAEKVMHRLRDTEGYKLERISPVSVFVSMRKYDVNSLHKWIRNTNISQSLHFAFEAAMDTMLSTGQRYLLAVHIDDKIAKTCVTGASTTLSPIMPCAILAQTLARVENDVKFVYFKNKRVVELNVSKTTSTVAVVEQMIQQTKDTDNASCDLCDPIKWATDKQKKFDCILIVSGTKETSSQNDIALAISQYRAECQLPSARVATVGLSDSTQFPSGDINFLDVTGFDEDVPFLLQQFFKGIPSHDGNE